MPLFTSGGKLLANAGKLATNAACCCVQKNKVCLCADPYGYAPTSVTATVTLGSLASGSVGSCTEADAAAQVNGTYVLPYVGKNLADDFVYSTTLADGTNVVYTTRCTTDVFSRSQFYILFCNVALACFQRVSLLVFSDSSLCSLQYGSTAKDTITAVHSGNGFDSDLYNPFGGPVSCGSTATYKAFFNVTVEISPQW